MLGMMLINAGINSKPSPILFKHLDKLTSVLDKTLSLHIFEEYLDALFILRNILITITETKPLLKNYSSKENLHWSEEFQWAKAYHLEALSVDWYRPGQKELKIVQDLYEKYLTTQLLLLEEFTSGKIKLDKEEIRKCLWIVLIIVYGSATVMPQIESGQSFETVFKENLKKYQMQLKLSFKNGKPIRQTILEITQRLQQFLLKNHSDDTESLENVLNIYEFLIFEFYNGHGDGYHQWIKLETRNRLISNKRHLIQVHLERIRLQHRRQILGMYLTFIEFIQTANKV